MDLFSKGLRLLGRGTRTGSGAAAGLGAALLALRWVQRTTTPKRKLLFARTLRPGEALRISLLGPDGAESVEVAAEAGDEAGSAEPQPSR